MRTSYPAGNNGQKSEFGFLHNCPLSYIAEPINQITEVTNNEVKRIQWIVIMENLQRKYC